MNSVSDTSVCNAEFEFSALHEARNYRAALLGDFSAYLRGNVLEVGAGIGQITSALCSIAAISKLTSIEPSPQFCALLREKFPALDILEGTVADLPSGTGWNAVLSINVLEHIQDDQEELRVYRQLLSETQGALCLFVPARPEIYAPIDGDFGHHRRYTRRELRHKLQQAGFKIIGLRYYNFVGYFAWWLSFCVMKKRSFAVNQVRLFDRAIFPLVHGFESRICAPPIGQNLMAIAMARD